MRGHDKTVKKLILKGYLMVNNSFTHSVPWSSRKKICDLYYSSVKWLLTENILEHHVMEEESKISNNSELLNRNHKAHTPTVHISRPGDLKLSFYYFILFYFCKEFIFLNIFYVQFIVYNPKVSFDRIVNNN
jgi:hypothetical protein